MPRRAYDTCGKALARRAGGDAC